SVGAIVLAIVLRRAITSGPFAPKRSTLPRPSLKLQYARLPPTLFSTTKTGMPGLMIPAIGPTAPWAWHGPSATSPRSTRSVAASIESAQPSRTTAPSTAPCIDPHIERHAIGGPAWTMSLRPSAIPGRTSRAVAIPVSTGFAERKRSSAVSFAASTSACASVCASAQPASRSPCAGGCHCSATLCPPAATMSSAKPCRPTLTTVSESLKRVVAAIVDSLARAAPGCELLGEMRREHRRFDVAADDHRAGTFELLHLLRLALRVAVGAADMPDQRERAARRGGDALRVDERFGERRGRVGVRAVAEHDVEHDRCRLRFGALRSHHRVALGRIDHRVRPAACVVVVAEVEEDVATALAVIRRRAVRGRIRAAREAAGQERELRFVAERA